MNDIFNKILMMISGLFLVAAGALGLKVQKDVSEAKDLKDALRASVDSNNRISDILNVQQQLQQATQSKLDKVANSEIGKKTVTSTQTTVIPGKVVPKTTTVPVKKTTRTS